MLKIESFDHNGRGIAKLNNKIVFIKNALPNEIVEIKIINDKKNYAEAIVDNYIETSNKRINVDCPYYNNCGGCDLLHISYDEQLLFKQEKITNIINKYLKGNIKINNIVRSDNEFNYRNKVTFQVNNDIGFFDNLTNNLIKINECKLCDKLINDSIKYLNLLDLTKINQIICKAIDNKLMIIIKGNKDINISKIKSISNSIYINDKLVYGNEYLIQKLNNYNFAIYPNSFFQINNNVCMKLYNKIKEYTKSNNNILDLYCGVGSIGIYINENNNILGIEINKEAIKSANINKKLNNLNNINFICGDSGSTIKNIDFKPDIIIIDPPRNGLNKETINNINKFNSKKIIYVSCDPMTLVRDLNILNENYNIIEITPFDMFPNTKHIETVCVLERK